MGWETSTRRAQLPKDWHRRRAIAKREAGGQCQWRDPRYKANAWALRGWITLPDGHDLGDQCDHIDRHGGDDQSNLGWLCAYHHNLKTRAEAQAAKPSRRRPAEKHPGLL